MTHAAIVLNTHHNFSKPKCGMYNTARATNNPRILIPTIEILAALTAALSSFGRTTSATHKELAAHRPASRDELNIAKKPIAKRKTDHPGNKCEIVCTPTID